MSKDTWLKTFYPKPAAAVPADEAVEHSLRKWIGLRDVNKRAHRIPKIPIVVGADSCALCCHYQFPDDCGRCPLAYARGGAACDELHPLLDIHGPAPWQEWVTHNNPEPMIYWLTQALVVTPKPKRKKKPPK